MKTVTLKVVKAAPDSLTLSLLHSSGTDWSAQGLMAMAVECLRDPSLLDDLVTPPLVRALRQWALDEPGTGVVAVACEAAGLDGIPWEHLPRVLGLSTICVVRQVQQGNSKTEARAGVAPSLLAAGWSGKPEFTLPGIMKELTALGKIWSTSEGSARVLSDPSLEELASVSGSFKPDFVHLVTPGIRTESNVTQIVLSGTDGLQFVEIDHFLSVLPKDLRPQLALVNACWSARCGEGPTMTRMIAERWGSITIGWWGAVEDLTALDFARFFYSRLLEGRTLSDVMRSYESLKGSQRNLELPTRELLAADDDLDTMRRYGPIPVIWTPNVAAVVEPLVLLGTGKSDHSQPAEESARLPRGQTTRGAKSSKPKSSPPTVTVPKATVAEAAEGARPILEVTFEPQPWLNPALLKNGRPAITRLVLNPDRSLRNVELAIACDTGNGISAVRQTIDLGRGPQPVPTDHRQFPVLYELIEAGVPRRQINFTITCKCEGSLLAESTVSVLWMGRAEWLDQKDTWHYVPAFVNPYDDGVLDVLDNAVAILKTIAGPESSFSGYQEGDSNHVLKQVEALFNCLRDHFKLNYITPPPVSVFLPGAVSSSGQRVRRPEEVISRHRGTCHDLAVLLASCMEQIGIHPLVYLIQGHTFVGFWKSDDVHAEFWKIARTKQFRMRQDPGRDWTITDLKEIHDLLTQKALISVEATKVTNRNATFSDAIKEGSKHWQDKLLEVQPFDVAIDIRASRRRIQPL